MRYCQINWTEFPPGTISYAVWLYFRFNLSYRDIKDLLGERDVI